jgi:hypothetical protein
MNLAHTSQRNSWHSTLIVQVERHGASESGEFAVGKVAAGPTGDAERGLWERLAPPRYRDYCGGLLLIVIGLGAAYQAQSYHVGTLRRMGPGFFPAALGMILALTGIVLLGSALSANAHAGTVSNRKKNDDQHALAAPPRYTLEWRGWLCICLSVVAFALLAEYTGLLPATFVCVFIAGLGDRDNSLRDILLLSIGMSIAGVVVFWWGLGVILPLLSRDYM